MGAWEGRAIRGSYVDAHVHLHEDPSLASDKVIVVAVSDDLESSKKTLELNAIPCIGIHPWSVENSSERDLDEIEKMAEDVPCLGEIGLDYRYVKDKDRERRFFERFLTIAREYDLAVNLHALDAWRDVFELLLKYDINKAYFHWYNGPLDLIEEIVTQGYFIGINVALKIQKKHVKVLERTPLGSLLTESDGPYNYRGMKLGPSMIPELVETVARVKGVSVTVVINTVKSNLERLLGSTWL